MNILVLTGRKHYCDLLVESLIDVPCLCWSVLTGPFCTHLASSPDVEPALPLHRQALHPSEARWLGRAVYICVTHQTTYKFKCPREEMFNWGSLVLYTSLRRLQICVCMQIQLVWLGGVPSGPGTLPGVLSVLHRTCLCENRFSSNISILLLIYFFTNFYQCNYLDAWTYLILGSVCTRPL